MKRFSAEAYKRKLEESTSCENCEKVPLDKLKEDSQYIFISYSHKDYKMVYRDLADLYESDIPNGAMYTGEWLDGKRHGNGTYTLADGTK